MQVGSRQDHLKIPFCYRLNKTLKNQKLYFSENRSYKNKICKSELNKETSTDCRRSAQNLKRELKRLRKLNTFGSKAQQRKNEAR